MACFPDNICPYEIINCVLNFILLFTNSVSMSMTMYNLKLVENTIEFSLVLGSLILSMLCVALKQSLNLEKMIKLTKIKKIIQNRENLEDIIEDVI